MKTRASTCSLLLVLPVSIILSCSGPGTRLVEVPPAETEASDPRGFDPLELSRDREVVPARYQRTGDIAGRQVIVEVQPSESELDSIGAGTIGPAMPIDTLNNQVYRVQLFTSRVHSEGRAAARVAEEIFDQPVYIDYQVPNYKVRVGGFVDRLDAEDYQQRARAAGYTSAWVVMVNVGVREVAPLYQKDTGLFLPVPEERVDTVTVDDEASGGSED